MKHKHTFGQIQYQNNELEDWVKTIPMVVSNLFTKLFYIRTHIIITLKTILGL